MSSILKPILGSQLQLGHPLSNSLVDLWLLNEGSGNKVYDLSGNGNTGTFGAGAASPTWVAGKSGYRIDFDDHDDYIDLGTNLNNILSVKNFSFVMRLCNPVGGQFIFSNRKADDTDEVRVKYEDDTDGVRFIYDDDDVGAVVVASNVDMSSGKSFDIAGTIDSSAIKIYVDGILKNTSDVSGSGSLVFDDNSVIGARKTGGAYRDAGDATYYGGQLEFFYLYNRALSASEIAQHYWKPFCMFERGPIELWSAATIGGEPPVGMAGAMTTNTGYWGW